MAIGRRQKIIQALYSGSRPLTIKMSKMVLLWFPWAWIVNWKYLVLLVISRNTLILELLQFQFLLFLFLQFSKPLKRILLGHKKLRQIDELSAAITHYLEWLGGEMLSAEYGKRIILAPFEIKKLSLTLQTEEGAAGHALMGAGETAVV